MQVYQSHIYSFPVKIPVAIHVTLHGCRKVGSACGSDLIKQSSKGLCQFLFGLVTSDKSSELSFR